MEVLDCPVVTAKDVQKEFPGPGLAGTPSTVEGLEEVGGCGQGGKEGAKKRRAGPTTRSTYVLSYCSPGWVGRF